MVAGDLTLNDIGTLGDFGEIKDWLRGTDCTRNDSS